MKRRFPFYYKELFTIAQKDGLSCPEGRALYGCNRRQNGWPSICNPYHNLVSEIDFLRSVQHATAVRWLKHWNNGGSIKTLRSNEEQLKLNRERDRERRENYKKLGIR